MPLAPVKLGPFKSGLVNVVDTTTVPDDALVECTNFDFDINGFLISRPPIVPASASPITGLKEVIRNLALNPRAISGGTAWVASYGAGGAGTLSYQTNGPYGTSAGVADPPPSAITTAARLLWSTAPTANNATLYCATFAVVPGQQYAASIYGGNGTSAGANRLVRAAIQWVDSGGSNLTASIGSDVTLVNGGTGAITRLSVTATAPAGAATALVGVRLGSSSLIPAVGDTLYGTGAMLVKGSGVDVSQPDGLVQYIDGSLTDTFDSLHAPIADYSWAGTVNASASILKTHDATGDSPVDLLGTYVTRDGTVYIVAVTTSATWIYNVGTGAWTQIWANRASSFCQYDNKVVVISTSVSGGYWEAGTFTPTTSMPLGQDIVFYQERFWAFGARSTTDATTVWFSNINVITPAQSIYDWVPASNFFTVSRGDGEWITGLMPDTNGLVIFRSASTYVFSFPSSPLTGTLRAVSATTGSDNQFTFVPYDDYYLVLCSGYLYQFINYRFYPLNTKRVEFGAGTFANSRRYDLTLSVFGERAIVFYEGALWVYSISLNTWSKWQSATSAGYFIQMPPSSLNGTERTCYVGSAEADSGKYQLYAINEALAPANAAGEEMMSTLTTKTYDQDQPSQYKRMSYWVVEATTARGLTSVAAPTALPTDAITWDDLDGVSRDILDKGSWDNPIILSPIISEDISFPAAAPVRAAFRCIQDMRYLSISYQVKLSHNGTAATAPVKIFSLTPYVRIHGGVSKKVA